MLEEVLKEINTNLERIANAMEKEVVTPKATTKRKTKKDTEEAKEVTEPIVLQTNDQTPLAAINTDIANGPIAQTPTAQNIVPVNTAAETFTQEDIARAMGGAMDMGRNDIVFGILQTFGTNSLMGIKQENYGDVARMLREAGIKI